MDFIDLDLLSMTGATCIKGVNFISKFFALSMLPVAVVVVSATEIMLGRSQNRRRLKQKGAILEDVENAAREIFIMVDDDHNHFLEPLVQPFLQC